MRILLKLGFFICMGLPSIAGYSESFQQLIDQAKSDETIVIPAGDYSGPIIIDKTVHIQTSGQVRLINNSEEPAIRVIASGVLIQELEIHDVAPKEAATIRVEADHNIFEKITVYTASFGFQLQGANDNEIRDSIVVWKSSMGEDATLSDKRNGIDLYHSHDNRMISNTLSNLHDGIYLEDSDRNLVEGNRIDHSRYGVHCMYTDDTIIRNNIGSYNITGAMVMAVRNVEVISNSFYKQSENVNSQGILLFDAQSSRFIDNHVEGNRVGFYVEQSSDNSLIRNEMNQNFIGIQFLEATGNRLSDNLLIGNVIEAEARSSVDNVVDGNFWDSFQGIDHDGDGRSDVTNAINPLFQTMVKSRPAFQLFFQSPGMMFLEGLFQADRNTWMTDTTPLMKPAAHMYLKPSGHSQAGTGVMGVILFVAAITTILYLGVKKT